MAEYFVNRQAIKKEVGAFVKASKDQKLLKLFIVKLLTIYILFFSIFYLTDWLVSHQKLNYLLDFLPFFIFFIGCLQYVIAQAAHEAIHFYIDYEDKTWLEIVCSCLVLYPIGITKNFKKNHMLHHTHFGDLEKDPDQITYMNYPTSKLNFWIWLIESLLGLSTLKRIVGLIFSIKKSNKKKECQLNLRFEFIKLVLIQGIIFFAFLTLGMWWSYFSLWILPLTIITKTVINIRLLAEHSPFFCQEAALRSFLKKDWGTNLLGVFGFQYHAEHHLFPGVLCNHLKNVSEIIVGHATNAQKSPHDIKIELFDMGYIQFLIKFYSSLPTYSLKENHDDSTIHM
ncbi:MAG: fatty acid desaturase [Rickettsia endosymbiont of Ixodes persulcatus]|nr:fatty acid desaturase [Rickettsia endosymbiont of Ixodes persulcatus]MCZ6914884.1 fatty acid desaturase [Rickettsia endosymbiont of Ixodes persulcatus]